MVEETKKDEKTPVQKAGGLRWCGSGAEPQKLERDDDKKRMPKTPEDRKAVGMKIKKLKGEGKAQDQAVAEALNMWRDGSL